MYKIERLPGIIQLGQQGEHNAKIIEFDVSDWLGQWPGAAIGITCTLPMSDTVVPAAGVTLNGNTLTWRVGGAITATPGQGTVVIRAVLDDAEVRSVMAATFVGAGHQTGPEPEPIRDWIDDAIAVMGQIAGYAESADKSALEASGYADQALQSKNTTDTLRDEALLFRNDAEEFSQAAKDSEQKAAQKATQAEAARIEAEGAANEAGRYYASLIGIELEVDVVNGTLNLYSAGNYSPIDIELNDRSLEVWGA